MRILFKPLIILCAGTFALGPAASGADEAELHALVAAENSFARAGAENGIRESFLQYFAADSLVFAPGPTNGRKYYQGYKDPGYKLIWQPIFATLAVSGDLGVTTGPWEMQKSKTDATALGWGQFLTVWKKQPDQTWKVAVDVGIDHAEPREPPGGLQLLYSEDVPDASEASRSFAKANDEFRELLGEGAGSAITAVGSEDLRILRDNSFPAVGKTAAKLMLSSENGKMKRTKSAGGMSAGGDLAYECGSYVYDKPNGKENGWYLSIWRNDQADWKLLVDLQKKAPPPKPPAKTARPSKPAKKK